MESTFNRLLRGIYSSRRSLPVKYRNRIRLFLLALAALVALPLAAQSPAPRVLFVYDEVNEQTEPYIAHFREAFTASGIPFDAAAAGNLKSRDLSRYEVLVLHGIVQAFNSKSPIRDWLKTKPPLAGKRVYLFVTANRWFLDNLFKDLNGLLEKNGAKPVDAVSMATKETDDASEKAAVKAFVGRVR